MFGFQGGETQDIVVLKHSYMKEAQEKWTFLTNFDLSTIRNATQLSTMIKDRCGISKKQADDDVHAWIEGKSF